MPLAPAVPVPLPAPFMGVNTREGLAALQPAEARLLVNWEPAGSVVKPRPGNADYSTGGAAAAVKTLAAFHGLTASTLIGVCGGSIYDFSGAVASLLSAAGYSDSRFQTECYNNRLIGVNGTDTPWVYDGATVGATGFSGSGLTLSHLVNIRKVRNRLWFCETNSADVWYGNLGSITGVLTKFQLSQIVGGGTCIAIGAHSQDAGDGPDDYTAFVMSTGEVVLYSGDPSTTFAKVGNYQLGAPPIGRDCLINPGGALHIITRMGLVPLTVAMQTFTIDFTTLGNFGKVGPTLKALADLYAGNAGWYARLHGGRIILNVPTLDGADSIQWVLGLTGAWTSWQDISAASMCEWEGELYFGLWSEGTVRKLGGNEDDGAAIVLKVRQAYSALGQGNQTQARAIRFDMGIDGAFSAMFGLDTDYIANPITTPSVTVVSSTTSTPWGSAWGSAWSTSSQPKGQWFSCYATGRVIGLAMEASSSAPTLEFYSYQILTQIVGPGA